MLTFLYKYRQLTLNLMFLEQLALKFIMLSYTHFQ